MADAGDSKSPALRGVRVRLPPPAPGRLSSTNRLRLKPIDSKSHRVGEEARRTLKRGAGNLPRRQEASAAAAGRVPAKPAADTTPSSGTRSFPQRRARLIPPGIFSSLRTKGLGRRICCNPIGLSISAVFSIIVGSTGSCKSDSGSQICLRRSEWWVSEWARKSSIPITAFP